ncbi:hypothetical protein [Aureimonas sp. AU40]|uniref:hypothetical protein n=1 Tax=Aureimonas sp. AU40 TaxID=1637747 RepID=UPI000784A7CC|nr:hypothetical protein [Aureimonas sp. AU40]
MSDSAALYHAALAEAYRRTRGRYPALDGLDYDDLLMLSALDDMIATVVGEIGYADIEPILPQPD